CDAGGLCALGDELANLDRCLLVGAGLQLTAEILLKARRGSDRMATFVVDHLRIDVRRRAEDRQPRAAPGHFLQRLAHTNFAADSPRFLRSHARPTSSCLPCGRCARRRISRPSPCRAPADANGESPPPPGPPFA